MTLRNTTKVEITILDDGTNTLLLVMHAITKALIANELGPMQMVDRDFVNAEWNITKTPFAEIPMK